MAETHFITGIDILIALLAVSLVLCFLRLAIGPDLPNRTVAFDLIAIHAVGIFALYAVRSETYVLLEGAIVTAVLGFLGTSILARFLERTSEPGGQSVSPVEEPPLENKLSNERQANS